MTSVSILQNFFAVRRKMNLLLVQEAKKIGLGAKQLTILRVLYREKAASMTLLADRTDSDLATVSRSVGILQKKGWLRREKDIQDKRKQVVTLTAKGLRKSNELNVVIEQLAERLFKGLSASEKNQFFKTLQKLDLSLGKASENRG